MNGPVPPPRSAYDDVLGHVAARRRRRRAEERRRGRRSLAATAVVVVAIVIVAVVVAGGVGATVAVSNVLKGVDLKTMHPKYPGVTTKIYDRHGKLLAQIPSLQNRTPVPYNQISKWLKIATVDIEDKRFYEHGGVDYQGIARAFLDDLQAGHVVQGASTIEQQLVRNLYLTDSQTFERKIKEAWLAIQMAEHWSKAKILGTYLNVISYGGVTYGCEAAAETYFNEHCSQLNIRQAALIAGLPQSPTLYNPRLHPGAAKERRDEVLLAMLGQGHITLDQYQHAVSLGLGLQAPKHFTRVRQPYFVQYVRDQLRERYGSRALRSGGLKVTTTIDPVLQTEAHAAMAPSSTSPTIPRRRWWRSIPARARSWRCSRRRTTARASTTSPSRPGARPARPSSRTACWRRWSTTTSIRTPRNTPRPRSSTIRSSPAPAPRTTSGPCRTPSRPARRCCRSRPRSSSR